MLKACSFSIINHFRSFPQKDLPLVMGPRGTELVEVAVELFPSLRVF